MWGAVTYTSYKGMPTSLGIVKTQIHCLRQESMADKPHTSPSPRLSVADVTDWNTSPTTILILRRFRTKRYVMIHMYKKDFCFIFLQMETHLGGTCLSLGLLWCYTCLSYPPPPHGLYSPLGVAGGRGGCKVVVSPLPPLAHPSLPLTHSPTPPLPSAASHTTACPLFPCFSKAI